MPKLFNPNQIVYQTITKDGEVTVNINLNLTLSLDETGRITVSNKAEEEPLLPKKHQAFEIPDFSTDEILEDFGKET